MPVLDWIGKDKVVAHHLDVPCRELKKSYQFGDDPGNMIVHGDNLEALKSLLPRFEGRVKCIYIDPPYNTGNEKWVYNDNMTNPKIARWLGQVVGREGEDFTRHDKWLCMMYPRLRLLHKLLSDDGAIFISIDDNELYHLKMICDEIFGAGCFVANISWQRTYSTRNDSKGVVSEVEHILVYGKLPGWQPKALPRTAEMDAKYKNPDNDIAPWTSSDVFAPGGDDHQGMVYGIQHPFSGKMLYPTVGRHWALSQEEVLEILNGWCAYELRDIGDDEQRAAVCGIPVSEVRPHVPAIVLSGTVEESRAAAQRVLKRGQWPRFYFTKNGQGGIRRKTYLGAVGGVPPTNLWHYDETGHTDEAKKEILSLFDGKAVFDTPKPTRLIERVLQIATDKNSIILDSFAGSGTTAQAVLQANARDGGTRRFILVELNEYAESVTAERVRRVIAGYGEGKNAHAGTGGGFSYYKLGEPYFLNGEVNPAASLAALREYVWFAETRTPFERPRNPDNPWFLGVQNGLAYYLHYLPDRSTCLDRAFLSTICVPAEGYVIFASRCALDEEFMRRYNITFKKIPRDVPRV